jgi:hypothetical protein
VPTLRDFPATNQALYYGSARTPLVLIISDAIYPNMWRMIWPDGRISDLANLSRIKDAAAAICERGPPARNPQRLHWEQDRSESPYGARRRVFDKPGPVSRWGYRPPESRPGKTSWPAKATTASQVLPDEPLSIKRTDEIYSVVGATSGAVVKADLETAPEAAGWVDGFYTGSRKQRSRRRS